MQGNELTNKEKRKERDGGSTITQHHNHKRGLDGVHIIEDGDGSLHEMVVHHLLKSWRKEYKIVSRRRFMNKRKEEQES